MRKKEFAVFAILLVMSLLVFSTQPVAAKPYEPPKGEPPAAGEWEWYNEAVTGQIIPQADLSGYAEDWLLLMSSAVKISAPTLICHPFRGGQFGWISEIRVWSSGKWQPVLTTTQWTPDEEGRLMTCAQAPVAGKYAVFGYWVMPEGWKVEKPWA